MVGTTGLVGLPPYLELAVVSGLIDSIRRHMKVCAEQSQGWIDEQVIMSLVMLNIAGGDCVDDLRVLEEDEALAGCCVGQNYTVCRARSGGSGSVGGRRSGPDKSGFQGDRWSLGGVSPFSSYYAPRLALENVGW